MPGKVIVSLLVLPIRAYRAVASPLMGCHCRYVPSCSDYAEQALKTHGVWCGSRLAVARILRCGPWGGSGYDPVPEAQHVTTLEKS